MPLRPSDVAFLEDLARRRARAKLGWCIHALVFVLVNAGLLMLAARHDRNWAIYPLLGWGLALALHGLAVRLFGPGRPLPERMVAREREQLRRERAH